MERRFVGVKELSRYLGLSPKTIYKWVSERKLCFHKFYGALRFDLREIDTFAAKRRVKPIL